MNWVRDLHPDLARAVMSETEGETISWAAQPSACRALFGSFPVYLMGIPWSAITFTLFGTLVAVAFFSPKPDRVIAMWEYFAMAAALLFTGSFALVGLGMLLIPIYVYWRASRTVFAITDRRILTIIAGRGGTVQSIDPERIMKLERRDADGGRGTLRIVTGYRKDSDGDILTQADELYAVPDVRAAESAVADLRDRRAGRSRVV